MKGLLPPSLEQKEKPRQTWARLQVKTLATPQKNKGKEKVPKPKEELPKHIDFHSSSKSSGDVYSLVLPLNQTKKGKKGQNMP
jgi:hypothetical protein